MGLNHAISQTGLMAATQRANSLPVSGFSGWMKPGAFLSTAAERLRGLREAAIYGMKDF